MKKLFFIPLLLGALMVSCAKEDLPPVAQFAGLGDNDGFPAVTTVQIPSYVQIVSSIYGGNPEYRLPANFNKRDLNRSLTPNKSGDADWTSYGTGTYVELFVKILSADGLPHSWNIPAGTVFCDSTKHYQHGFIIQDIQVQIPASDTAFVIFNAYCLNAARSSSDKFANYQLLGKTQNQPLLEMVQLLAGKQPTFSTGEMQSIIWSITEYNETLTDDQRDYLNGLP